jgi:nucleoid DNA-binding protein
VAATCAAQSATIAASHTARKRHFAHIVACIVAHIVATIASAKTREISDLGKFSVSCPNPIDGRVNRATHAKVTFRICIPPLSVWWLVSQRHTRYKTVNSAQKSQGLTHGCLVKRMS